MAAEVVTLSAAVADGITACVVWPCAVPSSVPGIDIRMVARRWADGGAARRPWPTRNRLSG